ncbi:outer membrane beta-barrel protein [Labilibaculum sp.]|uniref:outer membrane beta-barrel protein n=1 Tax=Labilibaculum sp. TaxID=2060723 RepID=UPI003567E7AB
MKKSLGIFLVLIAISGIAEAQYGYGSFRSFRIDLGASYSNPGGDELDAGFGFYVNPKFHVNDNLLLGAKYESTELTAVDEDYLDVSTIYCYATTIDYYVSNDNLRPFAGIDIGIYELESITSRSMGQNTEIELGSKLGISPKIGLSFGHLDICFQYSLIFDQNERFDDFNHSSIKLGFHLGGGEN